ncbi:class A beta-lactamase [Streptomyces sp. TP-A0874]|uniref:class A beta-lactamase n=1 Tax=Streptomyces sp. TP-A0874 TaxID=549819 RepID=UPI000853640D|nr:class A beta-lactamase [Streptomyces sp. TP-A0874]
MDLDGGIGRRTVITALAAPLLSGCGPGRAEQTVRASGDASPSPLRFRRLEREFHARLGVYAVDTGTGRKIEHRSDERFAMCSTFKTYAAASLLRSHSLSGPFFDRRVRIEEADLVDNSPITEARLGERMTVAELCGAAITHSDNTAGNHLLRLQGGPGAVTRFARSIGDRATRLDRWETELNSALRGDRRDTTTPAAIGEGYRTIALGSVLPAAERKQLISWLKANTTGDERIRAGLPDGWITGDKTGAGSFGTLNDVAVAWPAEDADPIVIALLSDRSKVDAVPDNALLADAAQAVVEALRS